MILLGSVLRELLPATILLVVLVVIGGIVILRARKMVKGSHKDEMPFTLSQLRKLHKRGELSDEEFQRAKASMIEKTRKE
ncbi:MAG: SHOCT domain-containing protein [Planctomycetes bacterium]|nr:SHOCT domain-containing protein [Planctomycetota bacterium]